MAKRVRNNYTIEIDAQQRQRISELAELFEMTQRSMLSKMVDWLLLMPEDVQHMVLSPRPGKRWVPDTTIGDWRSVSVSREKPSSELPSPRTHQVTRILDPEITPTPGSKASDRSRAKRAG